MTIYGGRLTPGSLGDTLVFHSRYENSYLVVAALSRKLGTFRQWIGFEAEGQNARHFNDQDHFETNGLIVFRWMPFPWDKWVETGIAAGVGISYAWKTPRVELIGRSDTPETLGYLLFEFEFTTDKEADWCIVARVHHRSGANGLFGGRRDASNAWCGGLKYRF